MQKVFNLKYEIPKIEFQYGNEIENVKTFETPAGHRFFKIIFQET